MIWINDSTVLAHAPRRLPALLLLALLWKIFVATMRFATTL
jgi:hypothetical protein